MPWARFDDRFPSNRKVRPLSDRAFRLYVSAVCWSAENLTDGLILDAEVTQVAHVRNINGARNELEARGLWERVEDGWRIHDYHDFNPTKAQVLADRKKNAARQEAFRQRKNGKPLPPKDGEQDPSNAGSNAVTAPVSNGGSNGAPARTRPGPSPTTSGTGEREGVPSGARGSGTLSLIPPDWSPTPADIQAAQQARTKAGSPVLTGAQLEDVTRKFVRDQTAHRRTLPVDVWSSRWQSWAERERPIDTGQTAALSLLDGGLQSDALWAHEQPQQPRTPAPPSFAERMAQLDALTADHHDTA